MVLEFHPDYHSVYHSSNKSLGNCTPADGPSYANCMGHVFQWNTTNNCSYLSDLLTSMWQWISDYDNIQYSFRWCNVSLTCGVVQLIQLESGSLLHSLMPIWNCMHQTVITKNGKSGTLKISILHTSLQMGTTNQYILDSCTAYLLTTLSRSSKECSGAHWFYRHLVLTGLLSLVPESWMESMTQTFQLESLSGDLVLLLHLYVPFLHIMQY